MVKMQSIALALKNLQFSWRSEFRNLSQIESMVFLAVASRPGIESSEIQEELDLDQPHASRILNKLTSKKIIRSLILRKNERKKRYFLESGAGALKLLSWIDGVIDELLVRNPAMLGRFVAALEDAPESVIESLEKGVAKAKQARAQSQGSINSHTGYSLSKRNRSDHAHRKLFV